MKVSDQSLVCANWRLKFQISSKCSKWLFGEKLVLLCEIRQEIIDIFFVKYGMYFGAFQIKVRHENLKPCETVQN